MKQTMLKASPALWFACICGHTTTAWTAESGRHDNSGTFVWIFLAFCGLIIVTQLIPAILVLLGFTRGVKKNPVPAVYD